MQDSAVLESKTEEEPGFLFHKDLDETVVLVLVYFCIAEMSVEVQSLGKSIAELQVTGVKASLTKRLWSHLTPQNSTLCVTTLN